MECNAFRREAVADVDVFSYLNCDKRATPISKSEKSRYGGGILRSLAEQFYFRALPVGKRKLFYSVSSDWQSVEVLITLYRTPHTGLVTPFPHNFIYVENTRAVSQSLSFYRGETERRYSHVRSRPSTLEYYSWIILLWQLKVQIFLVGMGEIYYFQKKGEKKY